VPQQPENPERASKSDWKPGDQPGLDVQLPVFGDSLFSAIVPDLT
jgi:hypothetical protein